MVVRRPRGVPGGGRWRVRGRALTGPLAATAAAALLAGCGEAHGATTTAASSSAPSTAVHKIQGRTGQLVLGDGFVPEPASPDVAAAYLTIADDGGTPARLTGVSSDSAAAVMPMTETTNGGVGSMAPLSGVVVPAHGVFRFRPGAAHLMLEHPDPVPTAGDTVRLTLTFSPGGTVTVDLPVTPIGATTAGGSGG